MTRDEFEAKAIRAAEKALRIPAGWWGTYRDVCAWYGTLFVRVRFSVSYWVLSIDGKVASKHDSRGSAISKGSRLARSFLPADSPGPFCRR
jgi:hypothetical protein